jgi:hypothetical protein
VNLPEAAAGKSELGRVSKTAAMLMLIIIVCLGILAVFANLQRLRHGEIESVVIKPAKPATSAAPEAQQR